jgi:acyl dehydratase
MRDAVRARIRALFDDPAAHGGFVASVIGREVGLADPFATS